MSIARAGLGPAALAEEGWEADLCSGTAYAYDQQTRTLTIQEGTVLLVCVEEAWSVDPRVVALPARLQEVLRFWPRCFGNIKEYQVAEGNPYWKAVEGVVYTKDGTVLVDFPSGRGGRIQGPRWWLGCPAARWWLCTAR